MRAPILGVLRWSGRTTPLPLPAGAPARRHQHRRSCGYASSTSSSTKSTESSSSSTTASTSLVRHLVNQYTALLDRYPLTTKMITSGCIAASGDLLCQFFYFPASTPADDDDDNNKSTTTATCTGDTAVKKNSVTSALHENENSAKNVESASLLDGARLPSSAAPWKSWDVERTGRFGVLGAVLVAPTVHHWYNFLHRFTAAATSTASAGGLRLLGVRVAADQVLFAPVFTTAWLLSLRTLERPHQSPVDWQSMLRNEVPSIVVANWVLWIPAQVVNFALVPLKFQVLFSNIIALAWNVYLSYQTSSTSRRCHQPLREVATATTTTRVDDDES